MHFSDKKFQQAYLKIISEQSEQAVIPTSVCKKCNLSFTDDIVKTGDACPECGETVEAYDVADYAGDGIDTPTPYEKPATECNDVATECGDSDDILEEEDFALECGDSDDLVEEQDEDDDLATECGDSDLVEEQDEDLIEQQDIDDDLVEQEEDDLVEEQDEDDDLATECGDSDLVEEQGEEDLIPPTEVNDYIINEQDEAATDETADDAAAAEDTDTTEDTTQSDATDDDSTNEDLANSKIISFTSADPAIIEMFEKVQAGELKMVAVPLDFEFSKEDKNENPDITAEVLDNFDIQSVVDETDADTDADADTDTTETPAEGEAEAAADDSEATETPAEGEDATEDTAEDEKTVVKENKAVSKPKFSVKEPIAKGVRPDKGSKYGPY